MAALPDGPKKEAAQEELRRQELIVAEKEAILKTLSRRAQYEELKKQLGKEGILAQLPRNPGLAHVRHAVVVHQVSA